MTKDLLVSFYYLHKTLFQDSVVVKKKKTRSSDLKFYSKCWLGRKDEKIPKYEEKIRFFK